MKKQVLKIFLLCFFVSFSQENRTLGQVDYTFKTNLDYLFIENYTLTFNQKQSFCEETEINATSVIETENKTEKGIEVVSTTARKNLTSKFYYTVNNSLFVRDIFLNTVLFYEEEPFNNVWKLHSETKKISTFLCNKATITFRGRDYIAWYTLKIPVPFGPWKLRGLPGLILEFYDVDKVFHVYANKVRLGKHQYDAIIDNLEIEKAISLKSYRNKKEILIDKMFARMSAKRPKGTKPLKRDKSCEDCSKGIEIFNEEN